MGFNPEFQAVVLAGGSGRLTADITTDKPKSLLPVGTKPVIWYSLYKLQEAGFTDVIIIVLNFQREDIQCALEKSDLRIKIEYFEISEVEYLGTADSLRVIGDKLKSNVIVMPGDVITDVKLKPILENFHIHNSSVLSVYFQPQENINVPFPSSKSKQKLKKDRVGVSGKTNKVVFLEPASSKSESFLPYSLINKHQHILYKSDIIDSHIYILKNWVIKYLCNHSNLSSIKEDLLPHIVKKQLHLKNDENDDIYSYAKENEIDTLIRKTNASGMLNDDRIKCCAHFAGPDSFGMRINTVPNYWTICNKIKDLWEKIVMDSKQVLLHPKAKIECTQMDENCVIWEGAHIQERTSIKSSTIGSGTIVHRFSRVFNSIIMNNVVVKNKVSIENCIICDGAILNNNCSFKNCVIGNGRTVLENSQHVNEILL